jgi:hypothetical protein
MDRDSFLQESTTIEPPISRTLNLRGLPLLLRLKPCMTFPRSNNYRNFAVSSTNPGRQFLLLLEDSFRRLELPSQNLSSDTCTCISCSNLPRTKKSWTLLQLYHEGTIPPELFNSDSLRGACAHSLCLIFNNFPSVEYFRLCALLAAAVSDFPFSD